MEHVLGLTDTEREVLTHLIKDGSDPEQLRQAFGPEVTATINSLRQQGIVVGDPPVPIQPNLAFGRRLMNEAQTLIAGRELLAELERMFQQRPTEVGAQPFEILTEGEAIRRYFGAIYDNAKKEVLNFSTSPYVVATPTNTPSEVEAARRGVRTRIIAEQSVLAEDQGQYGLAYAIKAGDEVRGALGTLPMKLMVADRTIGMLPLHRPDHPEGNATVVLRKSNMLVALVNMFEHYWERSVPLHVAGDRVVATAPGSRRKSLSKRDQVILGALLNGATDQTIATTLGVATRTVGRHIADLMTVAGVETRFQLGYQIHKLGWIGRDKAAS
ncbi:LuxR C-terminal-related transcriptional regulator [Streptosporangium sp. NPDC050855]|uniref:LuxR C-terminal-related transcriptional regulator n=1 Tax=Streptosporangium sp. NPDC050855 TaxID=3366194 RepID=UPI0037B6D149